MDNPLKKQPLAMLCTHTPQNGVSPSWRKTGSCKERDSKEEKGEGFENKPGLEKAFT
jgi:hypothetical protein